MSDDGYFLQLVEDYTESAYRVAYQLVRNYTDAEDIAQDIVQDSFLKVWKRIKHFDTTKSARAWVLTIVRNTALDFLRKRHSVAFSEFDQDDGENLLTASLVSPEPSALEEAVLAEDITLVQEALGKLNARSREVLNLRYGEDLSFEEMSGVLGRPLNTVKSQVRRALIDLKNTM